MCERKIALSIDDVRTIAIQSHYSNNYLSDEDNSSFPSYNSPLIQVLPIVLEDKISFKQFIANEKYNLQSFHSFKTKQMKFDARNNNKRLIKYFNTRSRTCTKSKNIRSILSVSNLSYDQISRLNEQKHESSSNFLDLQTVYARNTNTIKPMYCVKRHVDYMNDTQTKAALCFIQQLNTYIQQKHFDEINHFNIQTKKCDQWKKHEMNWISKLNNENENVDLSEQLLYDEKCLSKIYLNQNNNLLKFYESPQISNGIFSSQPSSICLLSNLDLDNTVISIESNDVYHSQNTENQAIISRSSLDKSYSTTVPLKLFKLKENIKIDSLFFDQQYCKCQYSTDQKLSDCANQEKYSANFNEFPWSSDRKSRMKIYRKVRYRFASITLIDIDISTLFRNILRSFHTDL